MGEKVISQKHASNSWFFDVNDVFHITAYAASSFSCIVIFGLWLSAFPMTTCESKMTILSTWIPYLIGVPETTIRQRSVNQLKTHSAQ
jgi:hypothetical protein